MAEVDSNVPDPMVADNHLIPHRRHHQRSDVTQSAQGAQRMACSTAPTQASRRMLQL